MWSRSIIELEAETIQGVINSTQAASTTYIPMHCNPINWWSDSLEKQKRSILKLDRKMRFRPSPSDKNRFDLEKNNFSKLVESLGRISHLG